MHRLNVLESTAKVDTRSCRRVVLPRRTEQGSLREYMRLRTNAAIAERLARISAGEGFFTREHREHLAHVSSRERYLDRVRSIERRRQQLKVNFENELYRRRLAPFLLRSLL